VYKGEETVNDFITSDWSEMHQKGDRWHQTQHFALQYVCHVIP